MRRYRMKNTKKEVPTVNETVDTSKETKIIDKETLPNLMKTDQLIEYCGYVKNCCSDLGTKNDSAEGWDDYINFQEEEKRTNSNSKLNKTLFKTTKHKVEVNPDKPIEDMKKTLDEMKAAALKVSFVSVKDIPENETLPIRVGNSYIALDKLDIQMVFEWVASKLTDIAINKAKSNNSDQVRINIKGIGDIIFGRNNLIGTVTNSHIFLPIVANDHNAHCSENDCKGCPYNKVCSPGR